MRRRALEKAARRWWRLPESTWSKAQFDAYSRVDSLFMRRSLVGPMFSALVATAPGRDTVEALDFLGASWFEDVLSRHPDDGEGLLLRARLTPSTWASILIGANPEYVARVPRLVAQAVRF